MNSTITHGLVVRSPYARLLASGKKSWEMRSRPTKIRGRIAIIEAGSGLIIGICDLVDCLPSIDAAELVNMSDRHCIPINAWTSGTQDWTTPWVIENAKEIDPPISYQHKSGAVTWVLLNPEVQKKLNGSLAQNIDKEVFTKASAIVEGGERSTFAPEVIKDEKKLETLVPFASDGTWFGPHLQRQTGKFKVGKKGKERKYSSFEQALAFLRSVPTAHWRRPNKEGNWGIVSAVEWKLLPKN